MPEPTPPDRAARLLEIVSAAMELDPAARPTFLAEACGPDETLRAEAESLLRFEQPARDFIEKAAIAAVAGAFLESDPDELRGTLQPGQTLGEYRIVSLLGEGGMGEVYLAEDLNLGRQVAIKLIKRGMASDALLRHFHTEKRILAGLNDPHIARLYGGAVAPDGLPYLVMEYVEGERLDDYCDRRRLPVPARLALFRKVCSAVTFAHQNLVIHRDLKPANIRVTPQGEPKLLDFGIAKLLDPESGADGAEQTVTQFGAMTPGYASPEQLGGEPVTTATDIYSLGVVLYELLCGRRPYNIRDARPDGAARAVREQPVPRPSAAPSAPAAEARKTTPERLRRQLAGDLDNIALMAMRREPARRYASVGQLSEDIRRHLDGQPVSARKETLRYVGAKFIARNKAAAAAAALILLTLIGGIATTTRQARRADEQARRAEEQRRLAERRFDDVRRLADSLMFEIHDSVQGLAGSTPTRKLIVTRALEYLAILSKEADQPALRRDLAAAYEKIGDIQGNPYVPNIGDTDGAMASYRNAERLRESLMTASPPPTIADRMALGRSYRALGDILEARGNFPEMTAYYRRSLDAFTTLANENPADLAVRDELCRAYDVLGDSLERTENSSAERVRSYERSLELRQTLIDLAPANPKSRRSLGVILAKLGRCSLPDKARAVEYGKRAITILKALAQESPEDMVARHNYAWSLFMLGNSLAESGDFLEALKVRRESLPIRIEAVAADPKDVRARFDLAAAQADVAEALTGAEQPAEALDHAREAVEILDALVAGDPANTVYVRNAGLGYEKTGDAHAALGASASLEAPARGMHWTEAQAAYQKARQLFLGLRTGGTMRATDTGAPEKLAVKIARCQAAAASLRNLMPSFQFDSSSR